MNLHYDIDPEDSKILHISGELVYPLDYSHLSDLQQRHFFEDGFINPLKEKTGCEFTWSHSFVFPSIELAQCIIDFETEQQTFFFQLMIDSHGNRIV
tara:strand:+ start:1081 stop:1371 length:291 start_codon:yes stop_codon:yes gene_type:complete